MVFNLLVCTKLGSCWCAFFRSRPLGVDQLGHHLLDHWKESTAVHNTTFIFGIWGYFRWGVFPFLEAVYASLSGTAQSPWL